MRSVAPFDLRILKKAGRVSPLRVFLCGPGYESDRYGFRNKIRNFLKDCGNVETVLGEELNLGKHKLKAGDLQTIESAFAHKVDFTILILESPGAIAELGTFSMMPNVRPRLFVMVPSKFYGSKSYIARGPLSVIANEHINNIIYFNEVSQIESIRALQLPVTLFKYAQTVDGTFREVALNGPSAFGYATDYYIVAFNRIKERFFDVVVLISIFLMEGPTFPMLVSMTGLAPDDVRASLGRLFTSNSIERASGGRYVSKLGLYDPRYANIDSTFVSRLRASYLAAA